jgi:RNA polymerase sigma-70 factor (ECF subfamily)
VSDVRGVSDAALVVGIGRWGEEALAEAYRRHGGPVFGLARRVLGDVSLAEEVTQEVFLLLWREPGRFDPDRGSLRSFLLVLTHRRSVDLVRAEEARRRREEREARLEPALDEDVERKVLELGLADRVRDALGVLPEGERRAIELAYLGGRTYREVAGILEEPEGTIKSRIRSGLTRMCGALSDIGMP